MEGLDSALYKASGYVLSNRISFIDVECIHSFTEALKGCSGKVGKVYP